MKKKIWRDLQACQHTDTTSLSKTYDIVATKEHYLLKCRVVQDVTWFFVLFEGLHGICFKKVPEICHFILFLLPVLLNKEVKHNYKGPNNNSLLAIVTQYFTKSSYGNVNMVTRNFKVMVNNSTNIYKKNNIIIRHLKSLNAKWPQLTSYLFP